MSQKARRLKDHANKVLVVVTVRRYLIGVIVRLNRWLKEGKRIPN